jgi:hypothetical protein
MSEDLDLKIRTEIVNQLRNEYPIEELVQFNEIDIQEKLQKSAYLIIQYEDLLKKEQMVYQDLENKYEALLGKRYNYYRFEIDKELQKPEIEKYYLPQDKQVRQMKKILLKQDIRVNFFKICVKGLNDMRWNMGTFSKNLQRGY